MPHGNRCQLRQCGGPPNNRLLHIAGISVIFHLAGSRYADLKEEDVDPVPGEEGRSSWR